MLSGELAEGRLRACSWPSIWRLSHATSWGDNRVDVFYRGADGSLDHVWRDDTEALIKAPKIEKVPGMTIKNDPTAVGVKW